MRKTYEVSTKLDADGVAKVTQVTVDSEGATPDQVFDQAARTLIVTAQGGFRRNGSIPATHLIMVKDAGTRGAGFKVTPESIIAAAPSFTPEQRKALMTQLAAMK